ncbi:hypothetical protein [Helicobacter bilis]|uniref:hypothetical protein n=1 Tax=Helicobacter bilis TaxID=37372 RepID=UPI000CF08BA0|nr:hypothetical protein [Helicobacter bilis]
MRKSQTNFLKSFKQNKGGRPRKEPTYTQTFRVNQNLKEFCESLENKSQFINEMLTKTKEYEAFMANKAEQENINQPSLF